MDTSKLTALSTVYGSAEIARTVNISKQLWHLYKTGKCDVPESKIERICSEYKLEKNELVLAQ